MSQSGNIIASTREIFDFHGGIHPQECKTLSSERPIQQAPLAPRLYLPLQQHIGKPAKPIVAVGTEVLKGQLLAEPQGAISVGVHAPTSGVIEAIIDHPIAHPSGLTDLCIVLVPDGRDAWTTLHACEHYEQLSPEQIQARIRDAGIAGMGGAGFPTEVKLHPPHHDKVATLILNAAECEPYITADDRLLRERAEEVIMGLEIMAYVLQPGECLIGIEDNKPEAIHALQQAAQGTRIDVVVIPTKYPSGGEKQLIKILTDKEVPSGKIPADIGVMCQNVGTAAAVYRAVRYGEPLISRITTLTGEQFPEPRNVEVLLGTPIDWLIAHYGYRPTQPERLIMGGPMMGFALNNADTPVVKTTNCILAPSLKELPLPPPAQACIRCGLCAEACPAELLPQQLYWFARAQEYDKAEHHNLFDCIECGACSYVCPSAIPLVHYYRHAKGEIRQQRLDHEKSDRARVRFEARQQRLEREKAEKEAKRKARAEAAAKAQAAKREAAKQAPDSPPATPAPAVTADQAPPPSIESLKTAWEKAQAKLEKMQEALEDAKANNPEQVEKLTRAVEKNQQRVAQAKTAYKAAQTAPATPVASPVSPPAPPPESDLEILRENVQKARAKLDNVQDSLEEAKRNTPEQVEKLTRAVAKNVTRLHAAEKALHDAELARSPAAQAAPVDLDVLRENVQKARAKLAKMQDALDDARANNPDQVEKLTRAVAKNKTRLDAAEHALKEAESTTSNENA